MKTVIIQCFRKPPDVPSWIGRCLESVGSWAKTKNFDYWLTDDSAFRLCGEDYLRKVGDNKRSITNLCRLELIRIAHREGYDRAIWMDADVFVFAPDKLEIPAFNRIMFARETWITQVQSSWNIKQTLNNCVVSSPRGDPDLDFIIQAIRHVARNHEIKNNFQLGIELIRGLYHFIPFRLLDNIGMFSNYILTAIAQNEGELLDWQARYHGTPVYAANLSASEHVKPVVPEAMTHVAMDLLAQSRGDIINDRLEPTSQTIQHSA